MLFHAPVFLFAFLPITLVLFYALSQRSNRAAVAWLLAASLGFYAWWDWRYLSVLIPSIAFNYLIGEAIRAREGRGRRRIFCLGILGNLLALGFFKYAAFAAETVNWLAGIQAVPVPEIGLPLGISFFTFTQIAYLVDVHARKVADRDPLSYGLFVTFFPHLIAGPILHHAEMMPQFRATHMGRVDWARMQAAAALFLIGLFKKLVLADTFAQWVGPAFDHAPSLSFIEAWAASLSYTFQLYFDFSGYSDMAIGLGLMMNIRLPPNFNSPYLALNIQDFWKRWHMTLSRFLRDYVYIPLGGNQHGLTRTLLNLFLVFLIGGLWHGAAWTFVAWGAAHGAATVVHRLWQGTGRRLPGWLGWFLTFMFVNAAWVLFRAETWADVLKLYKGMLGLSGFSLPSQLLNLLPGLRALFDGVGTLSWVGGGTVMGLVEAALLTLTAAVLVLQPINTLRLHNRTLYAACAVAFPFVVQAVLFRQTASTFLYFRF
jgi:alginate O-acetyltransferase complex protein AlgI